MSDNDVPMFNGAFAESIITQKAARGRAFVGFEQITIKMDRIEADYLLSNGTLSTRGTFTIRFEKHDDADKMCEQVKKAVLDAFQKFERMT